MIIKNKLKQTVKLKNESKTDRNRKLAISNMQLHMHIIYI